MRAANFTEFRTKLKQYLDDVEQNNETLIIKRGPGNGTVLISLDEYNSLCSTQHELSSKINEKRLDSAIDKLKGGSSFQKELLD